MSKIFNMAKEQYDRIAKGVNGIIETIPPDANEKLKEGISKGLKDCSEGLEKIKNNPKVREKVSSIVEKISEKIE